MQGRADISSIATLLGHTSTRMSECYAHADNAHLQRSLDRSTAPRLARQVTPKRTPRLRAPRASHAKRSTKQASQMVPTWNQLLAWLREMDLLRRAEAA